MATQSLNASNAFEEFAAEQVASGRYANAFDVLDAAKAALAREIEDDDLDIEYVRQAVQEGIDSGVAEGDVFARLRAKYNLPSSR